MSKNASLAPPRSKQWDSKLFRTSTAYLIEPPDPDAQEATASPVKNLSSRTPYFQHSLPGSFQVQTSQQISVMSKPTPSRRQTTPDRPRSPLSRVPPTPTPMLFTKIENILKEAAVGHKNMKQKVQTLKLQQIQKSKPPTPKLSRTPKASQSPRASRSPKASHSPRAFVFSLSPPPDGSPLPSPKHSPHSPRYPVSGSMTDRQKKRQAEAEQARVARQAELEEQEVRECTFQPQLVSKVANKRLLEQRQAKQQTERKSSEETYDDVFIRIRNSSFQTSPRRSQFRFGDFKNLIKFELARIPLEKQ